MLTIDLTQEQVKVTNVIEIAPIGRKMSLNEARHQLDDAKLQIEQAVDIAEKDVFSRVNQAISILIEIDIQDGWQKLGYKSMYQLIKSELKSGLNLSLSQIYRRVQAGKIRRWLEPICPNIDAVSNQQLLRLRKLPPIDWINTLDEIISTAPRGRVTLKHFEKIVERRLDSVKAAAHLPCELLALPPVNKVENLNDECSSSGLDYEPSATLIELDKPGQNFECGSKNASSLTSSAIKVTNLVTIQCNNNASEKQQQYSGCWGIVQSLYEQSAKICVCGEIVEYFLTDINPVENPTPTMMEVSYRTANLWQTPDLPASVRHLLTTFYQRQLDFSQSDKDVLAAIESYVRRSFTTDFASKKEDAQIKLQNNLLESGVDNQIPCIISATE